MRALKGLEGRREGGSPKPMSVPFYVSELNFSVLHIFSLGWFRCTQLDKSHSWNGRTGMKLLHYIYHSNVYPMNDSEMNFKGLILLIALVTVTFHTSHMRHKTCEVICDCHMPVLHVTCGVLDLF